MKFFEKKHSTGNRKKLLYCFILFFIIASASGFFCLYKIVMNPKPLLAAIGGKPAAQAASPAAEQPAQQEKTVSTLEKIKKDYTCTFFMSDYILPVDYGYFKIKDKPSVDIPDSVKLITGLDNDKTYLSRINAVKCLGENLSAREVTALLYFLHKKTKEDVLLPLELNAVKNDTVMHLMNQSRKPAELAPHLIAMYCDKTLDNTWRDYTIQFMSQWYDNIPNPEEKTIVCELLDEALSDEDNIPAASIIAMSGLVGRTGFSRERVSAAAYKLCADEKTSDTVKTAALQICAKLNKKEILPIAREIISKSSNVPLKISAVAVLGAIGESPDKDILGKLVQSRDTRLRNASKAALKKIKA